MKRKLNPEQVQAIRERIAAGEKQDAIAWEFGVSAVAISDIKRGRTHRRPLTNGDARWTRP